MAQAKARPKQTVLPLAPPQTAPRTLPPPTRYEDFLKDVFIPEPPTLLDDYKGRTPEAISEIMRNNRIILKPVFKDMRERIEKENPGISRNDLTRKMYQEYIKGYYRLVKSVDDEIGRVLDFSKGERFGKRHPGDLHIRPGIFLRRARVLQQAVDVRESPSPTPARPLPWKN